MSSYQAACVFLFFTAAEALTAERSLPKAVTPSLPAVPETSPIANAGVSSSPRDTAAAGGPRNQIVVEHDHQHDGSDVGGSQTTLPSPEAKLLLSFPAIQDELFGDSGRIVYKSDDGSDVEDGSENGCGNGGTLEIRTRRRCSVMLEDAISAILRGEDVDGDGASAQQLDLVGSEAETILYSHEDVFDTHCEGEDGKNDGEENEQMPPVRVGDSMMGAWQEEEEEDRSSAASSHDSFQSSKSFRGDDERTQESGGPRKRKLAELQGARSDDRDQEIDYNQLFGIPRDEPDRQPSKIDARLGDQHEISTTNGDSTMQTDADASSEEAYLVMTTELFLDCAFEVEHTLRRYTDLFLQHVHKEYNQFYIQRLDSHPNPIMHFLDYIHVKVLKELMSISHGTLVTLTKKHGRVTRTITSVEPPPMWQNGPTKYSVDGPPAYTNGIPPLSDLTMSDIDSFVDNSGKTVVVWFHIPETYRAKLVQGVFSKLFRIISYNQGNAIRGVQLDSVSLYTISRLNRDSGMLSTMSEIPRDTNSLTVIQIIFAEVTRNIEQINSSRIDSSRKIKWKLH